MYSSVIVIGIEWVSIVVKKEITVPVDWTEAVTVGNGAFTT